MTGPERRARLREITDALAEITRRGTPRAGGLAVPKADAERFRALLVEGAALVDAEQAARAEEPADHPT